MVALMSLPLGRTLEYEVQLPSSFVSTLAYVSKSWWVYLPGPVNLAVSQQVFDVGVTRSNPKALQSGVASHLFLQSCTVELSIRLPKMGDVSEL